MMILNGSAYCFKRIDGKDLGFLEDMLYLALYVEEGQEAFSRDTIYSPELYKYIGDWNDEKDLGYIAIDVNTGVKIGAVWLRTFSSDNKGYGYISDDIPELSIAVIPQYRGKGAGTKLMKHLLSELPVGIGSISLSVNTSNPAKKLYERLGFKDFSEKEGTATMRYDRPEK